MAKSKVNELEKRINKINMDARREEKALILKIPVPIQVTIKGLVAQQSTVDYSGTLEGGISIDFDAKETESTTSFPLKNIKEHQLNYLKMKFKLGGVAFFMIHFKKVYPDKAFLTPINFVDSYMSNSTTGRKSIPISEFKTEWLTNIDDYIDKSHKGI